MSQNKTRIQGLDVDDTPQFHQPSQQTVNSGFYSRSNRRPDTIISGMNDEPTDEIPTPVTAAPSPGRKTEGKPIVGFLYSVSRTMAGEYWPLHIGSNTIGNNPNCDIILGEGTVSGSHATLQIRRAKNTGHISAWISDTSSTNGTMVNDTCLGSTPVDCKNGDIITVGDNYQFYFVLIDVSLLGLNVIDSFIPVSTEEAPSPIPSQGAMSDMSFDPWGNGPDSMGYGGSEYNSQGSSETVGLDGSLSGINKGRTRPI